MLHAHLAEAAVQESQEERLLLLVEMLSDMVHLEAVEGLTSLLVKMAQASPEGLELLGF